MGRVEEGRAFPTPPPAGRVVKPEGSCPPEGAPVVLEELESALLEKPSAVPAEAPEAVPPAEEPAASVPAEPPAQAEEAPRRPAPLSNEAVTGHTAALWKYRPVPENEPEPAPEYRSMDRAFPGGRITAARVRGKKHKHEGTNCDDWFETASFRDQLFIAVADGAGSRKFSRIGAQVSCQAAAACLRQNFEVLWTQRPELAADIALDFGDPRCMEACGLMANAVQQAVLKAREAVETAFRTRSLNPAYQDILGRPLEAKDLSATLLLAAVVPAGDGHLVATCQVGDGMIALIDSRAPFESAVKLMGEADSGGFSGETEFLTSSKMASLEALQSRTKLSRGSSDLLLLMTDGVADDYFPGGTELRRLYFDLIANGVLDCGVSGGMTPERLRQCRKVPQPLCYPWVNDQTVQVPLHYARRVMEAGGLTLEELWKDRAPLAAARADLEAGSPGDRLLLWLDNYVERGSFDDRTLAVVQI